MIIQSLCVFGLLGALNLSVDYPFCDSSLLTLNNYHIALAKVVTQTQGGLFDQPASLSSTLLLFLKPNNFAYYRRLCLRGILFPNCPQSIDLFE
ncbi:hypothetical protein TNCV_4900831 [Trichonephila clavipes]|nr:hypothetical protein TNCV_4900831 [Trichonephila clavipes]